MGLLTQVSPVDLHLSYDGFRPYRARNALVGGPQRGRPALAQIMEISLARLDATEHVKGKGIAPGDRQINGGARPLPAAASRLHQQAGHKTAPDQHVRTSNQLLQCASHPQKTFGLLPGCPSGTYQITRRYLSVSSGVPKQRIE
jgi:hypothetical protein